MTTFVDGPAKEEAFALKRAPLFLRVTRHRQSLKLDALDQLTDSPLPEEDLMAYVRIGEPGRMHVLRRGKGTGALGGGWESVARYRLITIQPEDGTMRDNALWQAWCLARVGLIDKEPVKPQFLHSKP